MNLGSPQLEAGQLSLRLDSVLLQPARLLKLVRLIGARLTNPLRTFLEW